MDNMIIGNQIAKYRKAAGLTQEELGRAAGVSTQAVSRWECGGAPDISLLPAIADRLGVSIDALFGREPGEAVDLGQLVQRRFQSIPEQNLLQELNRLVWAVVSTSSQWAFHMNPVDYLKSCEEEVNRNLVASNLELDSGLYFGVAAEDMCFSTICPRPEAGYSTYFSENEEYRRLFSLLSAPGCLELLRYLLSQNAAYFSGAVLAAEMGMPEAETAEILARMEELGLLGQVEIRVPEGVTKAYILQEDGAYVPLLYLARCIMRQNRFYYVNFMGRTKPMLQAPTGEA